MTDLRELLRTTAAEGSESVDLAEDAVLDRIRHRRTRRFTVAGTAVATAAVVAGAAWLIRPEQPPTASTPTPRLVTSGVDVPSGMEALLQTTLFADANGCVQATTSQNAVTLVWPMGYTVRGDTKSFEIVDGANNVVARSGVPLAIGGGGGGKPGADWAGLDCAGSGGMWMVGQVSSR